MKGPLSGRAGWANATAFWIFGWIYALHVCGIFLLSHSTSAWIELTELCDQAKPRQPPPCPQGPELEPPTPRPARQHYFVFLAVLLTILLRPFCLTAAARPSTRPYLSAALRSRSITTRIGTPRDPPLLSFSLFKVVENETATAVCRKLLRLERPSHADLNKVISSSLAGALVPTAATSGARAGGGGGAMLMHLGDKLAHLCPNKDFVFLRASMVPQVTCVSKLANG